MIEPTVPKQIAEVHELDLHALVRIAHQCDLFKQFSEMKCSMIRIDYVPPRTEMFIPRTGSEFEDGDIELVPSHPIPILYRLDAQQFGGETWVALIVNHRVIVKPWLWEGYERLAKMSIVPG